MRETIFRGKRIDNGKWVYGDLAHFPDKINIDPHKHGQPWRGYAVIPETVEQYTGLIDKNSKKIFEGDIVKEYNICGEEEGIGVVHWSELFVAWHWANNKCMYRGDIASYEVIGNIHDNPELIEEV